MYFLLYISCFIAFFVCFHPSRKILSVYNITLNQWAVTTVYKSLLTKDGPETFPHTFGRSCCTLTARRLVIKI